MSEAVETRVEKRDASVVCEELKEVVASIAKLREHIKESKATMPERPPTGSVEDVLTSRNPDMPDFTKSGHQLHLEKHEKLEEALERELARKVHLEAELPWYYP